MTHEWKVGDRFNRTITVSTDYEITRIDEKFVYLSDGKNIVIWPLFYLDDVTPLIPATPEPQKLDVTKPMYQTEAGVEIRVQDILIQTYCTRKGGGWAPVLENGVEIKHLPTGISVRCDAERYAHANRASAMKRLRFLIAALAAQENTPEPKRTTTQIVELVNFEFGPRIMLKSDGAFYVNVTSRAKVSHTEGEGWGIEEVAL